MGLNVVSFVNEGKKKADPVRPILFKLVMFTVAITLSMILISNDIWIGYAVYAKEVIEFILFIYFLKKERRFR